MSLPFTAFLALLLSTFLDLFSTWPGWLGLRLILAAVGIFILAAEMPITTGGHIRRAIQIPVLGLCVLALWILLQALPLPILAHPVWDSARAALGGGVAGHISVDVPGSEDSLIRLGLTIATLILGAGATIDRRQAELGLTVLLGCTAILAAAALFGRNAAGPDMAANGVLLALATGMLVYERFETRRLRQKSATARLLALEAACIVALAPCALMLAGAHETRMIFPAACGIATFGFVVAVRRLGLSVFGGSALAFVLVVLAAVAIGVANEAGDTLSLAYTSAPAALMEATRRMIQDSPWTGTGAGSFPALQGQYRGIADPPSATGPTLAAAMVIELGRPIVWLLIAVALTSLGVLLRGALTRGRDSAYATLGSAVLVALFAGAFVDGGLTNPAMSLLSSGLFGLALTQAIKRSAS